MSAIEARNHRARNPSREEPRNARAARSARIAYSVRCASFRVTLWIVSIVSGLVSGNNHRTSGPIIRDVFEAEKLPVEANEMNAIQAMSGTYRLSRDLVIVFWSVSTEVFYSAAAPETTSIISFVMAA